MVPSKPPRRSWRPRFGLRTLFVVVTVAAIGTWLGHHFHWIWQRREFLAACAQDEFITVESMSEPEKQFETTVRGSLPTPPGMLWLFDESAMFIIFVDWRDSKRTEEGKRLFPEAVFIGPPIGNNGFECLLSR